MQLGTGAASRLRSAGLVAGGITLGIAVAVGAGSLTGGDEAPTTFGRTAAAEGSPALLDAGRLAEVDGPRTRAASPQAAVEAFLAAEQARDHDTSFGYLSDAMRLEYGSPAAWAADHPDALPPVTGFDVEAAGPDSGARAEVVTLTRYRSSLDPVAGLVPARARTAWVAVREDGGWAVDVGATTQTSVLPADALAVDAVQAWAADRQRCTGSVDGLRGRADLAEALCDAPGAVRAAGVAPLAQIDAAPLQTSFGADVVSWARTVTVDGPVPLRAVVAPVDDAWRVVGVLPPPGTGR